jgi:hypothetical protein
MSDCGKSTPSSPRRPVTPAIKRQIIALYKNGDGFPMTRIAGLLRVDVGDVQKVVNHEEPERVI